MLGFSGVPCALVRVVAQERGVPLKDSFLYSSLDADGPCGYLSSGFYSQTLGKGVGFGAIFNVQLGDNLQAIYFSYRGGPRRPASFFIYE